MRPAYRLMNSLDPENRIEDAAMFKALHDEYGDELIVVPPDVNWPIGSGTAWGMARKNEHGLPRGVINPLRYWHFDIFRQNARREIWLCDLESAKLRVLGLHAAGKDAFVKAMQEKYLTQHVPVGTSLEDALGDLSYSFVDAGVCLIVQRFANVRCERRYFVVGGQIVTSTPNAAHLTPLDSGSRLLHNAWHFQTPADRHHHEDRELVAAFDSAAWRIVADIWEVRHYVLDLALIDGEIGIVELNPLVLGGVGLFAADVRAIARASRQILLQPEG